MKAKGLPVTGKKDELVARLIAANAVSEPTVPAAAAAPVEEPAVASAPVPVAAAPDAHAQQPHKHAPIVFTGATDAVCER